MKRLRPSITLLILLIFTSAAWADFEQATQAYKMKDFKTALEEFRTLARAGDARSMFNLGNMYRRGEGIPVSMKDAARLYQAAAERGHSQAQNSLGIMYATGNGVKTNDLEAYAWFTVAALQGNKEAKENAEFAASLLSKRRLISGQLMARQYFESYVGSLTKNQ